MIMITQNDYFAEGLPVYTVNRHIEELDIRFKDGSHIVYVNVSYRGNDPIGQLMHDFRCKKAKNMYHKELADSMKHFKEEGGREIVCEAVEKYAKKKAAEAAIETEIKAGIAYNIDKIRIITRVQEVCGITKEEAENLYNTYTGSME